MFLFAFSVVIFNYLFFIGFIKIQKQEFRQLSFSREKSEILKIAAADLYKNKSGIEWHDNNSEVSINGKYFEVVQIKKMGTDIIITIVKDEKENNLMGSFFSSQKKNNDILLHLVKLFFNISLDAIPVQFPSNKIAALSVKGRHYSDVWLDPDYYFKKIKPPQTIA